MAQTPLKPAATARKAPRQTLPPALGKARYPRNVAAPVLVEFHRGPFVESRHRGHVVQVDVNGKVEQGIGDPDLVTSLRSAVKPFGVAALLEAGGAEAFHLTGPEIAVMSASHHGEDAHVRTIQAMLRRAGLTQSLFACGTADAPEDDVTAARLAREGEAPGAIRHNCSGFHTASLLMSKLAGWSLADYWRPEHPSQVAMSAMVGRVFGVRPSALVTAVDQCGVLTYAFPLVSIARAYALLADPDSAADAARRPLVPHLTRIRDAMMAAPEMIGGTHNAPDTMLMRARPGLVVMKGGAEGLRGIGLLRGARGADSPAAGVAIKIEDGDLAKRANRAVTVEALSQLRVLNGAALERVADLHRPPMVDPRGVEIAQAVPTFRLAPLSEL
ncbi:MAG TPA: asparaginase, partial [Candidatus Limnocylindria bacterium]|nr:asparaginase [Candidatus Limnocylindria bacterium]